MKDRSYQWVFYTTSALLFASTVLRSPLVIRNGHLLLVVLLWLFAWLVLFVSEPFISRLWRHWFHVYLVLQILVVVTLLYRPESNDFFAVLFGVLGMQALHRYPLPLGAACLVVFVPLMAFPLLGANEPGEMAALVLVYTAVNVILGGYSVATRRIAEANAANQASGQELTAANAELREYSERLERLAVAQERNRLARELHDSVTQTIFSMTLASQSAGILLKREPARVDEQLDRLGELTRSALAEMHLLVSELTPDAPMQGGLAEAIGREIERRKPDGLRVTFTCEGDGGDSAVAHVLPAAEERGLLRIVQEALNNVAKHSGTSEAHVELRFRPRAVLEIEDHGRGFDVERARQGAGVGLSSMNERAAEIGWDLEVTSTATGTKVVARRRLHEGGER